MSSFATLKESLDILKKQYAELKAQEVSEKKVTRSRKKSKKWLRGDETGDEEPLKKKKKVDVSASMKKKTEEKLAKEENWRYVEEGKEKKGKGKGMAVKLVWEKSVMSVLDEEEEEEGESVPEWFERVDQSWGQVQDAWDKRLDVVDMEVKRVKADVKYLWVAKGEFTLRSRDGQAQIVFGDLFEQETVLSFVTWSVAYPTREMWLRMQEVMRRGQVALEMAKALVEVGAEEWVLEDI
ncbi:hypothetical protein FISHEDRAFT_77514 [Fistulina hepatica ATCC 64428]|uniref:Uncharacterized protein n=1 Tax=Fistulina hepatica ATCC 64428 TaxID=1128425 RepID=A0A0D7A344_9AGAR|nr:hypothetical protein FISHEDRAFT_77514 [Fistulina hepatica ATCC 64428]